MSCLSYKEWKSQRGHLPQDGQGQTLEPRPAGLRTRAEKHSRYCGTPDTHSCFRNVLCAAPGGTGLARKTGRPVVGVHQSPESRANLPCGLLQVCHLQEWGRPTSEAAPLSVEDQDRAGELRT